MSFNYVADRKFVEKTVSEKLGGRKPVKNNFVLNGVNLDFRDPALLNTKIGDLRKFSQDVVKNSKDNARRLGENT